MPPHSPFDASPIGTVTIPGIPIVRSGTCGKRFAKPKPDVLGRNPGTVRVVIAPPSSRPPCRQP